jgi:hypothetical protein
MDHLGLLPTMLIVWGVIMVSFLALLAYRGQITRYEEDQLFLNDNDSQGHKEQDEIVRKVNRLQPFVRAVGGAVGLVSASIVGMFFYDMWQRFQ